MIIEAIELHNYRNYENLKVELDKGVNVFFGKNAQGKTNLLEAAYISATTKSHRGSKDKEIIKFDCEEGHIKTTINKSDSNYQIDIHLKKNKSKGIAINRIPAKKSSDVFGILKVIFFSPEDLDIVKRGPAERRRFLDVELCQIDKIYLSDLTNYNKALNQRNKILREMPYNHILRETLDIWTNQLIKYGKKIIEKRSNFIEELSEIVKNNYKKISNDREELIVSYEKDVSLRDYELRMLENLDKDERFAQTSVGPHRDDMKFSINGNDARKFGSQGQQRSCALALKLSEIEIMEKKTGEKPVLLLDDVLSELDRDRQKDLLKSLYDVQTLITCTGIEDIINDNFKIDKLFKVSESKVEIYNKN